MDLLLQIRELKKSKIGKKDKCPWCDHDYCPDCGCFMDKIKKIKLVKTESHNTVTFVALEPDVEDNNWDIATKDNVITACHQFMINMQEKGVAVNINHQDGTDIVPWEARFVESYILPADLEFADGIVPAWCWLVAIKFSDALYQSIINWEIIWISIEGWYDKTPITS